MTVKVDEPEIAVVQQDPETLPQVNASLQTTTTTTTTPNDTTPVATAIPIQDAVPLPQSYKGPETVDVIAPTNMAAGYQFNVEAAGRTLRVSVPPGGAAAGQRFSAIILSDASVSAAGGATDNPHAIPRGDWRDGLCDCCKFGCCHSQCCLTFWCASCALGQIMTRLRLNWCGDYMTVTPSTSTFRILFILTVIYLIINWVTGAIVQANDEDGDEYETTGGEEESAVIVAIIQDVVGLAFAIYVLYLTIRTRSYIRRKYDIPTKSCGGCEDCCCSFWCNPCTICQMARHTANFEQYSAACCSDTGLHAGTPGIV